jgi:hypothetical protein
MTNEDDEIIMTHNSLYISIVVLALVTCVCVVIFVKK